MYTIEPMTILRARCIAGWRYPDEYAMYSFENDEETISELMNGEYVSCLDDNGVLIGYFCFGFSARIPADACYASDAGLIDIGLGLKPELCGQGYGKDFLRSGMEYAKRRFGANGFRLVVAAFNKRAIAVYRKCGFHKADEVEHKNSKAVFFVMLRADEGPEMQ